MQVIPVARFAGLDLASSPDESDCIDMLNVDLDVRGALRSRDGYDNFTSPELTNQPDSLFPFSTSSGTLRLLVGNGNRVDALSTAGTSSANTTAPTTSPHFFTRYGGPTAEAVYFANGTDQVRKFTADVFSSPGGLAAQTGKFVAVTPTSNRLVVARESGATAGNNPSSVNFSDAGTPETFTSTNYVDLDPGDGEAIMGLCTWGNYLFAFKGSKFYVFYGETEDVTGAPIFNYRKVDSGLGLVASRALCAARDGVYFLARTGVYRTTGGVPELVSQALDPLFVGGVASHNQYYQGSEIRQGDLTAAAMTWHKERIHVSIPTGASSTNDKMFVYDPRYEYWLDWNIAAAALAVFTVSAAIGPELVFAYPTGSNHVGRHARAYDDDDGVAITSRYRTGFQDYGSPGQEKDIQSTRLWGTGTIAVSGSRFGGDLDTAVDVVLGAVSAIDAGLHNKQKKGEAISYQFADSDGSPWRLHRYNHYLRGAKPPAERSE